MGIAGGETARISSAAVEEIVEFAADIGGWTENDAGTIGTKYNISATILGTLEQIIQDYYISPEERQTLGTIMSGGDIGKLAGSDGAGLLRKRAAALRGLMASGDEGTKWNAADAYKALAPKIEGGEVVAEAAALRRLIASGDEGTKAAATEAYDRLQWLKR